LRRAIRLGLALAATATTLAPAAPALAADTRVEARAAGGDRATAVRVAQALLARPLDMQLTRVRCERAGAQSFCGLTLSGVKFHRRVDTGAFDAEVRALVRDAFAVEPALAEVDLWVTVPADAGQGAVVSGDFAQPTSRTVYATSVPRAAAAHAGSGPDVFWDPAFRREIAGGSAG
jgi:hypothetical protein